MHRKSNVINNTLCHSFVLYCTAHRTPNTHTHTQNGKDKHPIVLSIQLLDCVPSKCIPKPELNMHNAEIMEINFKLNELFSFQPKGLAYCDTKLSTSGEHWMTGAEHIVWVEESLSDWGKKRHVCSAQTTMVETTFIVYVYLLWMEFQFRYECDIYRQWTM